MSHKLRTLVSGIKLQMLEISADLHVRFQLQRQLVFPKSIPIIINSFNRYSCLKALVDYLLAKGYSNIVVLDNASGYEPLLSYYRTAKIKVIHLERNFGHMALWESGVVSQFGKGYFVYTDPDVLPVSECPPDFLQHFLGILRRHPSYMKVGFGIRINDLPDHYPNKTKVINWESKFWKNEIEPDVYIADVDTTFALYAPGYSSTGYHNFYKALRTGGKYLVRHLPWYADPAKKSLEEIYYLENAGASASWAQTKNTQY